jgi:hypothetical protein
MQSKVTISNQYRNETDDLQGGMEAISNKIILLRQREERNKNA